MGLVEDLRGSARAGYDGITIGVESGDGEALAFMDKGYAPEDIIAQTRRLDRAPCIRRVSRSIGPV